MSQALNGNLRWRKIGFAVLTRVTIFWSPFNATYAPFRTFVTATLIPGGLKMSLSCAASVGQIWIPSGAKNLSP